MTTEPRVEELLATIRRAIDRDINELDARDLRGGAAPLLRGSLPADAPLPPLLKPPRDAESDISSLRQRVQRHKLDTVELPKPILRVSPSLYAPIAHELPPEPSYVNEPQPYNATQVEAWRGADVDPAQQYLDQQQFDVAPPDPQALISQQTAYAAQASFQALANSMMGQLGGDAGLHETAREMLRPMLKHWLDDHLPSLVERLVRDEIERVARRGR